MEAFHLPRSSEGVQTFGTVALLSALQAAGTLTAEQVSTATATLWCEYCVDLPVEPDWIVEQAEASLSAPGPALLAFSRPALWRQPRDGYERWSRVAEAVAVEDPTDVAPWVYAATVGLAASSADAAQCLQLRAAILANAATMVGLDPEAFAGCAAAAAAASAEVEQPDPTELALLMAFDLLQQRLGPAGAASVVARLGSQLADDHRDALRRVLFGPEQAEP